MFDIRKIQEDVIYKAVKAESDEETARKVVYGGQQTKAENNPEWVKAAMHRLESSFDSGTVKQIRRNCQCGYGMEEKLALVKELKAEASNIEELRLPGKQGRPGCSVRMASCFYSLFFVPALCLPTWIGWRRTPGASVPPGTARSFLKQHFPAGQTWSC